MLLAFTAVVFVALLALSMPIVFALGIAGIAGLALGGYPLQMLPSSLVAGSQNWVLLAIPSFVFAGTLMERCGMSHALVDLARALVGWLRGGLGMSVIVVSYFFSDICGSKMAEVSALGSTLMPPLRRAGYRAEDLVLVLHRRLVCHALVVALLPRRTHRPAEGRDLQHLGVLGTLVQQAQPRRGAGAQRHRRTDCHADHQRLVHCLSSLIRSRS